MPDAEGRAFRIRRFLRQLFEKTYGFNLDALAKKPQKEVDQVARGIRRDRLGLRRLATVTRLALGGSRDPGRRLDASGRSGAWASPTTSGDTPTVRGVLERAVPKNRGAEFSDLLEELAHDTCVEGEPDCPRCELQKVCPTGLARKADSVVAAKVAAKVKSGKAKSAD